MTRFRLHRSTLLLVPAVAGIVVLLLIPLAAVLARSFTDPQPGWQNFTALWHTKGYRNIVLNSFEISAWTAGLCLLIGYPVAYRLTTLPLSLARLGLGIVMVPLFTSLLARLYAWTLILADAGLLNNALRAVGYSGEPVHLLFTRSGVVIGTVYMLLPYMILILYSTMRSIDPILLEAARSLGAKPLSLFFRVFLPMTAPGIYAGLLIVFIMSLGYYFTPTVLGAGADVTVSTFIIQQVSVLAWGPAAAMAVVLLCATVVLYAAFDWIFPIERMVVGGIRK